ncbi:hypothetical protein C0992_011341 [Termitomyces sp. T32_za158]|nr:hypothetical protein C0992_011341 [Termitomyces sp. T32_za158]
MEVYGKKCAKTPTSDAEIESSNGKKKKQVQKNDTSNLMPKASTKTKSIAAKKKVSDKPKAKATKGQLLGSRNFGIEEKLHLLDCVNQRLSIGGAGWKVVVEKYNKWATEHDYAERDDKSLKGKFDALVREAKSKPTGSADCDPQTNPLAIALKIEEAIEEKAGTLTLNDSEFDEAEGSGAEPSAEESIIEISEDEPAIQKLSKSCSAAKSKGSKDKKNAVLTKAYQIVNPLENSQPRRSRNATAIEALSSITNMFNPSAIRERDEARMSQNIHMAQLTALQQEVRELHLCNEVLTDRLMEETRRADRADSQVQLLKTVNEQFYRRRHRGSSSEDNILDHSYRQHRYHKNRSYHWHSHSHHEPNRKREHWNDESSSTNHSTSSHPQPSAPSHVFFGQQPPSPGPSVFSGSMNTRKLDESPP